MFITHNAPSIKGEEEKGIAKLGEDIRRIYQILNNIDDRIRSIEVKIRRKQDSP